MHPNPVFHTETAARNLAYARDRAFGILGVSVDSAAPHFAHIPFLLDEDGTHIWLHLVRSNPIARALKEPRPAKIAVSGPDSYVSPDWYGIEDQVPTWNYIAVHISGMLELRPQNELHDLLDRQSAFFEKKLLPKTPWASAKMTAGVMERMMRSIVPCRMSVETVDGTWKLNQNKPDPVRLRAADHLETHGIGTGIDDLAARMRAVDGQG